MEIVLVLHNIRSCYNVGAILRTAEGFGASEVILSGYTPRVHDPELLPHLREKLDREIHKTALGAEDLVKVVNVAKNTEIGSVLADLRRSGCQIVGLDNHIPRRTLTLGSDELGARLGERVALILGEEVDGIAPEMYDEIDLFVEIPMRGEKESFNVSVAAGIAMYGLTFYEKCDIIRRQGYKK